MIMRIGMRTAELTNMIESKKSEKIEPSRLSGAGLAYLGDAVYELIVREQLVCTWNI